MKQNDRDQNKIMIVDDNPNNLDLITKCLKEVGYKCAIATNGIIAIERAKLIQPGVIVLDIKMPDIDGYEVCRKLKQNKLTQNIPVIFLTALDDIQSKKKAFNVGGVDYITKPLQKEELIARVSTHLENYLYKNKLEQEVKNRTHELEKEISLRKNIELQLRDSIKEKEILLQEIHHRVKNNMAIIHSFIGIKEDSFKNEKVIQVFKDTKQRIKSMAMVHEKLYKNKNFQYINIHDYFIELINDLITNYSTKYIIDKKLNIENINLPLDTLIPLGLIANEILTNSLKYAFDKIENPLIMIDLKKKSGYINLRIADNGIGFQTETDFTQNNSFGIDIIKSLVTQLQGLVTINSKSSSGTEYILQFPIPEIN